MKKKNPIYFMPNGPILNNKEKWKIIIPGISLKLHSDRAMVGYYLLAQSSTYHQNFSDTHLAPGKHCNHHLYVNSSRNQVSIFHQSYMTLSPSHTRTCTHIIKPLHPNRHFRITMVMKVAIKGNKNNDPSMPVFLLPWPSPNLFPSTLRTILKHSIKCYYFKQP